MSDNPNGQLPPAVWPCIRYVDAFSAIEFLQKAFGFTEQLVVPSEDGNEVVHAELRWPLGGGVMLGSATNDGLDVDIQPGSGFVFVVTDEPDALYEQALAAGAELKLQPDGIKPIPASAWPSKVQRPSNSVFDTTVFESIFNVHLPPWQDGIRQLITTLRERGDL